MAPRDAEVQGIQAQVSKGTRAAESFICGEAATVDTSAEARGLFQRYWTLDRIAHVIWELFGIRYRTSSVWYLMQRMGWSSQKPQRRSLARNEQEIAHWKHYVWPQIKKVD
jgi:transposase